jgi:hypothetical protein
MLIFFDCIVLCVSFSEQTTYDSDSIECSCNLFIRHNNVWKNILHFLSNETRLGKRLKQISNGKCLIP